LTGRVSARHPHRRQGIAMLRGVIAMHRGVTPQEVAEAMRD